MGSSVEVQTFERSTLFGKRWFFRIVDFMNHEKLAQSEAYNSARARDATADRLAKLMGCKVIKVKR